MDEITKNLMDERDEILGSIKQIQSSIGKINAFADPEELIEQKDTALQEINEILERYAF